MCFGRESQKEPGYGIFHVKFVGTWASYKPLSHSWGVGKKNPKLLHVFYFLSPTLTLFHLRPQGITSNKLTNQQGLGFPYLFTTKVMYLWYGGPQGSYAL